jgi:tetratricopeptide (TPR) repeat protein
MLLHEKALAKLEQAIELDPSNAKAWYRKGMVLYILKRYEESIAAYDNVIKIDPNFGVALRRKAYVLRLLGRDQEANAIIEEIEILGSKH